MNNSVKPITAIVLGASGRGKLYGDFSLEHPELLKITGIAEPVEIRNEQYAKKYNVPDEGRFYNWEDVFKKPKIADAIIIAMPDHLHFAPCMKALDAGYDILLEKPIAQNEKESRTLVEHAKKTGRIVGLTHVLRYSPYFRKLKSLIDDGSIGQLVSIQHFEPVEHIHMSHSYVRGSWRDSEKSTPLVLAKSSHDLDILRWMIGKPCKSITAYGGLKLFKKENAPEGAPLRCTDGCPAEHSCPWSALKIYHRDRTWLYVFDLPEEPEKQGGAILEYLKTSIYGRCVYRCDNNQPDHYIMSMEFEDNITVNFSIEGFTSYGGRRTRVMGTMGDIVGDMETMTYTDFRTGQSVVINADAEDAANYKGVGHGGGDEGMIREWIEAVRTQDITKFNTPLNDSLESHIMAFKAEESRLNKKRIEL